MADPAVQNEIVNEVINVQDDSEDDIELVGEYDGACDSNNDVEIVITANDKSNGGPQLGEFMGTNLSPTEELVYDRQIRLWGIDAQQRMISSKILLLGKNGIQEEAMKNMILAGKLDLP
ncbi:Ubiquitin-activating enzyme [Babesia duncani]|uniref:Ubiquitin-activating enzyme n=1 Tax=Babesia duncani TaxID=323732 RepID=A0AAD9UNI3_9APIC|nr:Ubiquitin-activating enzyme [Babesia duncani]